MSNATDRVSVRPLGSEDAAEFRAIADHSFHPERGPQEYDETTECDRISDPYGAFDGEELVSVCTHYDLTANLRGEWTPLAGLASVATPPERRRQGYAEALVDDALARWRGEFPLAALWAFSPPYYRQYGWATANRYVKYTCPLDQLSFARGSVEGRARPATAEEWADLRAVNEAFADERSLVLRREDEQWWRDRLLSADEDDRPWACVWERDGEVVGYVVYEFGEGSKFADGRVSVEDVAYADHEALQGLLGFLAEYDSQADEVVLSGDSSADLLDLVPDSTTVDSRVMAGPMVRVVDVADALEACPYPADATGDLVLDVTDGTADWNDDRVRFEVANGEGTCSSSTGGEPDVTVDIGTLSQLVVGYHDVTAARRLGDLSVADEATADTLSTLFPPERVFLRTYF
ncbi:enhanced intracellular survival protein Eis [Halosimplex sp. TS25]|uniref:GNAT family N-acetyltransferase n=1 Tax=Halosimplex rarum TaxID=3396619 RepID=UPI0039E8AC71